MNTWRKMKLWIPLLLVPIKEICVMSCPDNMFMLPGTICCDFCPQGRFVAVNCTKQNENEFKGVTCEQCSECAEGTRTVSPCTNFSDTVCAVPEFNPPITAMETATPFFSGELVVTFLVMTVVFFMIVGAVLFRWYMRRKAQHDPAEEPFKIRV